MVKRTPEWLVNRLTSELEHLADYLLETVGPIGWEYTVRVVLPHHVRRLGELASNPVEKADTTGRLTQPDATPEAVL